MKINKKNICRAPIHHLHSPTAEHGRGRRLPQALLSKASMVRLLTH